ncbi:hypothetical protein HOLleu_35774 [Holothuria leucospilota]|uniref:Uncharacterized protein n=1 Tax=Holothuria leucospilota TaxID=206669 RepID=A0A9Q1BE74_HOLLE|nr:hypothetical protein HOLleu_35774 [Holothuria leucospilota]
MSMQGVTLPRAILSQNGIHAEEATMEGPTPVSIVARYGIIMKLRFDGISPPPPPPPLRDFTQDTALNISRCLKKKKKKKHGTVSVYLA